MAGEASTPGNPSSTPESPTSPSVGFNTDQLPYTSRASDDDAEASVDPEIVRDEPEELDEEEDGEDLYNDNFMDDYRRMEEHDQYESIGLDDSLEDDRDMDQIMEDRRAAEMDLEARDGRLPARNKLPHLLFDQGNVFSLLIFFLHPLVKADTGPISSDPPSYVSWRLYHLLAKLLPLALK